MPQLGRRHMLAENGGERGIRTPGGFKPTHAFQACALNHSAISPTNDRTVTKLFKVCNIFRSATHPRELGSLTRGPGRLSRKRQVEAGHFSTVAHEKSSLRNHRMIPGFSCDGWEARAFIVLFRGS